MSRALADVNLVACYFMRRLQHQRGTKEFVCSVTISPRIESAVSIIIKPMGATLGICGMVNDEEGAKGGVERWDLVGAEFCDRIVCSELFYQSLDILNIFRVENRTNLAASGSESGVF